MIRCPKCGGKIKTIDSRIVENINAQFRKKRNVLTVGVGLKPWRVLWKAVHIIQGINALNILTNL